MSSPTPPAPPSSSRFSRLGEFIEKYSSFLSSFVIGMAGLIATSIWQYRLRIAGATGYAERDEALEMVRRLRRRGYNPKSLAGDKGYRLSDFPQRLVDLKIRPHLAIPTMRPQTQRPVGFAEVPAIASAR
jgi:hypothetical protein